MSERLVSPLRTTLLDAPDERRNESRGMTKGKSLQRRNEARGEADEPSSASADEPNCASAS